MEEETLFSEKIDDDAELQLSIDTKTEKWTFSLWFEELFVNYEILIFDSGTIDLSLDIPRFSIDFHFLKWKIDRMIDEAKEIVLNNEKMLQSDIPLFILKKWDYPHKPMDILKRRKPKTYQSIRLLSLFDQDIKSKLDEADYDAIIGVAEKIVERRKEESSI